MEIFYILDDDYKVVACTIQEWRTWRKEHDLVLAKTEAGKYYVQTVFLGASVDPKNPKPFWTAVFWLENDTPACDVIETGSVASATFDEAIAVHAEMVVAALEESQKRGANG